MLSTEVVRDLTHSCMVDVDGPNTKIIEGVAHAYRFDLEKIEEKKALIRSLLIELPDAFMKSKGGGMAFSQACRDRHGQQWTDYQLTMESLFVLGMAAGYVSYCIEDRELLKVMPYFVIDDMHPDFRDAPAAELT